MLLLLAGIFILAHSFIPHTHHQDHICIINSPCYNQQASLHYDTGHNHHTPELKVADNQICTESRRSTCDPDPDEIQANDPQSDITEAGHSADNEAQCRYSRHAPIGGDDHTHDGHCHTDGCALFEVLVYDPLGRKPVIECPCSENDHNHSELVQALLLAGHKPPASWYNLPFRQKPHIDTYSGHNHSLIPGLRAPPAC